MIEAGKNNVKVKIIHGSSILTAVGETGLSLYKFGQVTSIPFLEKGWSVETPYQVIKSNMQNNLHTLILLDLKPKENKYMAISEAIRFLYDLEEKKGENIFSEATLCMACAALGSDKAEIKFGKAEELINIGFKGKPQCLIIPAKLHFMEEEVLRFYKI